MKSLARALSAELLKNKRTLSLWLTMLAPLSLAFLEIAMVLEGGKRLYQPGGDSWLKLIASISELWTLLLLPLFITLEMGLLGALEHNSQAWKQLYAAPLPRWSIYAAKQLTGMGIIALSMLVLGMMTTGVGLLINLLWPELGFDAPIPWLALVQSLGLAYLAAWLIISIHLWISLRWSSFVLAMTAGIIPTVCGVMIINSKWVDLDPWLMPGVVAHSLVRGDHPYLLALSIGLLGGVVVALLGGWDVSRRDFP